jgi:hypothetical protein
VKTSLRKALAVTAAAVALTVGLGVPSASPAAAASCSEVTAVGGALPHVANVTDGSGRTWQQIVFDGVYAKTSAYGCSGWRYVALLSYSAGYVGGESTVLDRSSAFSNTVSFPSRQTYFWVPPGSGVVTLEIQAQSKDYFGSWRTAGTASWRVNVPSTGFSSATGEGMAASSCSAYDPSKTYITSKWC